VCHIAAVLGQRQPNVSQHLMVLRQAGLVSDRKDGLLVHYRVSDERIGEIMALTRALLEARGEEIEIPPIPVPPVAGCGCPRCDAMRPSSCAQGSPAALS